MPMVLSRFAAALAVVLLSISSAPAQNVQRGNPPGYTQDRLSTLPEQEQAERLHNPRISHRNPYASPRHYYMEEFFPMDVYGANSFHALAHFVRSSLHWIRPGVLTDATQGLEGWSYQIIVTDGTSPDHVDRRFEFFVQTPYDEDQRHFIGYGQFGSDALYWISLREITGTSASSDAPPPERIAGGEIDGVEIVDFAAWFDPDSSDLSYESGLGQAIDRYLSSADQFVPMTPAGSVPIDGTLEEILIETLIGSPQAGMRSFKMRIADTLYHGEARQTADGQWLVTYFFRY